MKILVINGPNLNMLGKRDPSLYGKSTLGEINKQLLSLAKRLDCKLVFFQSNHEGTIIDFLQKEAKNVSGILINPGALTHYGYCLRDALEDTKLPIVEVHLSNIRDREDFRKIDVLDEIAIFTVMGFWEQSYLIGLKKLVSHIKKQTKKI